MNLDVFVSSIVLGAVLLAALAWRWRVRMKFAIPGGILIGGLAGWIASWIDVSVPEIDMPELILVELALIGALALMAISVRFYRDPERSPEETENVIISPADGRVCYVNKVEKGSALVSTKGSRKFHLHEIMDTDVLTDVAYLVGIDMNILNVHVNRSPIRGQAVLRKRVEGSFMSLRKPEAEVLNERVTTVIGDGRISVGVIQIASRLVRRIVSYVKEGDSVEMGQRIGAIVFGSQVDVAIPDLEHLRVEVKPGDEVKAGVSVIARYG